MRPSGHRQRTSGSAGRSSIVAAQRVGKGPLTSTLDDILYSATAQASSAGRSLRLISPSGLAKSPCRGLATRKPPVSASGSAPDLFGVNAEDAPFTGGSDRVGSSCAPCGGKRVANVADHHVQHPGRSAEREQCGKVCGRHVGEFGVGHRLSRLLRGSSSKLCRQQQPNGGALYGLSAACADCCV